MKEIPIGLNIKMIIQKKNLSVAKVAARIGISRQGVYNTYSRSGMNEDEIEKWASALGVDSKEILENEILTTDKPSFGSEVLDTLKRLVEVEMQEKNERIRNLEDMLRQSMAMNKELLGKSEGGAYAGLERGDFFYPVLTDMLTPAGIYS
jgi:transcriptional regulator with XRE-family HTH domain